MRRASVPSTAVSLILGGGLGLYAWLFYAFGQAPDPSPASYQAAADWVRARHRGRAPIYLLPDYATRARIYLGDLAPRAVPDPTQEDLATTEAVHLFALFGAELALKPKLRAIGFSQVAAKDHGPIRTETWQRSPSHRTRYDFRASLSDARVYHVHGDTETACARWRPPRRGEGPSAVGARFSCPSEAEWFYVGAEWHRMGAHPRLCLWAHPPRDGALVIEYVDVPLHGYLFGRGGHTLNSSLFARAPVDLGIEIEGQAYETQRFALSEHDRSFWVKTATHGVARVRFYVSAPDAGANHFCFDAEIREAVAP